ncbi:MAG TPA: molybdopterin cofactor-binding domain-containing protein [Burkholderiales bacterium]|nr:molybdopterin cofactor-binding domain-containing protein [Burkholderiales bacterium]
MSTPGAAPRKLPGSLETNRALDQWLTIGGDGTVTVRPGKVEIGQGILTALVQIVAEELDISAGRIRLVAAATTLSPNEGITSGSRSIQESGLALRFAAAEARELLLARAAATLQTSVEQLTVRDGVVSSRTGGSVSYWELADETLLKREATGDAPPKAAADYELIGRTIPRVDIPAKVMGSPVYVHDLERPGMLHARVVRPEGPGMRLASDDHAQVEEMPGVVKVVRDGSFLAVVAQREEQAIRAARRLARIARWEGGGGLPGADPRYLLDLETEDELISEKGARAVSGERSFSAEYSRAHLAHASLGPSCAVAEYRDGRYTLWTHSQGIFPLRADLAAALGVAEETIEIAHMEGAGCYGHNAADDAACDAALVARALPGVPVRVQWTREDEFGWEPFGSPMVVRMQAALDRDGGIVSWSHDLWSHGHSTRPGGKGGVNLLGAWHLAKAVPAARPGNPPLPAGGSHRNAIPLYEFPNQRVTNHLVRAAPLRTSAMRSLGAHVNVLAIESFIDELALAAGADPIEFRLRHLKDTRARAVIEKAAELAGWRANEQGNGERGRGIGFARYKNLGCYVAVIVEVAVAEAVRVQRAWCAVDVGQVINADGVINQTEGGIVQTVSWTLKERVAYDRTTVTSRNWNDYPILTFAEVPQIEVALVDRPELPPLGAGEGTQGPTAGAIGNAIYNALKVRLRDMPFTRERLIAALAA